jgi:FlaG/FlaF family flagellin (archaellin)
MSNARFRARQGPNGFRRRSARFRARRSRGVSDVVATILLLALTVTLFASIFFFVTSFPTPPAQNSNQFQGSLQYTANQSFIQSVTILHLGGPVVAGADDVYLKGAVTPSYASFTAPVTVSAGLGGAITWNLGQKWVYTFPLPQPRVQNITIYIVSPTQLLFSVTLPGQQFNVPPTVLSSWSSPASPTVRLPFTVYVVWGGTVTGLAPTVNLQAIPGLPATAQAMVAAGPTNEWKYTVASGLTTTNGTYTILFNGVNSVGQTGGGTLNIAILNSASSTPLSVAVSLTTAPPLQGSSVTLAAFVTYSGSLTGAPLNVSFYVNQTAPSAASVYVGNGPAGLAISGVGSQTAFSTTKWAMSSADGPRTYLIVASATVAGTTSARGNLTFAVPLGIGASNSTTPTVKALDTIHGKLYLNTTAYGPGPFTFETASAAQAVNVYINFTSNGTSSGSWTIDTGTITITPGTSVAFATPTAWNVPNITTAATTYKETIVIYVTGVGLVTQTFQFTVPK